jgi:hypothetical protein
MRTKERLFSALRKAEHLIFAQGAPLGTDNYFAVRKVLRDAIDEAKVSEVEHVFIVQGEHYSVPGRPTSTHSTRELADARALELINIILWDLALPLASDWREGLGRIKELPSGDEADVWIEEHDLDAVGCTVDDSKPAPITYRRTRMNMRRRQWAHAALSAFGVDTGQHLNTDEQDMVGDLLGDLMHYCEQRDIDFEDRLRSGRMHFDAERTGQED